MAPTRASPGLGFPGGRRAGQPGVREPPRAGGLGWLDGFDELLARCGLANNGAPFEVKTKKADGSESNTTFGLHGKIANIPPPTSPCTWAMSPPTRSSSRATSRKRTSSARTSG